ncbi:MAG: Ig-like domain-containing protein [Myxococcota bacterium]
MRLTLGTVVVGLSLAIFACSGDDDGGADLAPDTVADTADSSTGDADTTAPDATPDTDPTDLPDATPDADADADAVTDADTAGDASSCSQPCLNEFGKNDKKLCPAPQTDWLCKVGCCVPVFKCKTDADCLAQGFAEGQCADERFDCRCDVPSGVCGVWYCASDADCGTGELCAAGACQAAPATTTWALRIPERATVLTTGATTALHAEMWDAASPDIVLAATVTWSSSATDVAAVDSLGVVTGGANAGMATITAKTADGRSVATTLRNVVPAPADTYTVIAVEEGDLAPIAGTYALVDNASGDLLASGAIPADGVVRYAGAEALVDVHIFGTQTDWVSWLRAAPGTLFLPTPRTFWGEITMDKAGAVVEATTQLIGANIVRGLVGLDDYPKDGELELSLTSFPFSASLFDFNLQSIIGANVKRYFDPEASVPGVDPNQVAEIPGGVTFALGTPAIRDFVLAAPRGTHRVWSLGGRVRVDEVVSFIDDIISAVTGGDFDFALIVRALVPLFGDFWSTATPTGTFAGDGAPTSTTISPSLRIPLGLASTLTIPTLPAMGDLGYADSLFIIAGALTPDGLLYPIGLTAGNDQASKSDVADGIVDSDTSTPEVDPFTLPSAPLNSGLGGPNSRYATAAVAVNLSAGPGEARPEGGSAVISLATPGAPLPTAQSVEAFLGFPMASSWDATTRTVTVEPLAGADVQRVLFKGEEGQNWTIWMNGSASYVVPDPTTVEPTLVDRAVGFALLLVSSLDFVSDVTAEAVAAPGGDTLDTLLLSVKRASFIDIQKFVPNP